jgi:hypothetical protein
MQRLRAQALVNSDPLGDKEIEMSTPAVPPDEPVWKPDAWDEIRWGRSVSGDTQAGDRDDYADRAGLPRLPLTDDGQQFLTEAFDAAQRWTPPRESSEFDPARMQTPPPNFRKTKSPISDPHYKVTSQPRPRRPIVHWIP